MDRKVPIIRVFSTKELRPLADEICQYLQHKAPAQLTGFSLQEFGNENREAKVPSSLSDSFVIFLCSHVSPVDSQLMKSIAVMDAIRNADPLFFLAVPTYFEYCRSDNKKHEKGVSEMGKVMVEIMAGRGIKKVILLDIHSQEIVQHFESLGVSVIQTSAKRLWISYIKKNILPVYSKKNIRGNLTDKGGERAKDIFNVFSLPYIQIIKERDEFGNTKILDVAGDVSGKCIITVEDEIAEGGTLGKVAGELNRRGAVAQYIFATHPIMSIVGAPSNEVALRLDSHPLIKEIITTDSVPDSTGEKFEGTTKFKQVSVVPILVQGIFKAYHQFLNERKYPSKRRGKRGR